MQNQNIRIYILSILILFVEIFLIRWISTEVRIFAYVNNLVLLACFLGIGAGCYYSKKEANILLTALMMVVICVAVKLAPFQNITVMLSGFADSLIWGEVWSANAVPQALLGTLLTLMLFTMILVAFIPLGQLLGRWLDEHSNIIVGYSINILASLVGIWTFNFFSFLYLPPWTWFLFAFLLIFYFLPKTKLNIFSFILSALLILLVSGTTDRGSLTIWSPYQKLVMRRGDLFGIQNGFIVNVNNTGYMALLNLSEEYVEKHADFYIDRDQRKYNQYEIPYYFTDQRDRVLIVGAGGGNDAAGAIRGGAKKIDAVEIDPGIYTLGKMFHPEDPYSNPKVNIIINDARAFLKRSSKQYDIISFGLLDSHTLSSSYNNMRLDHYVYTKESFKDAKKLLKSDGIITIIFAAQRTWISERIYGILKEVFGEVPYVFLLKSFKAQYGWGGVMFVTGNDIASIRRHVQSNNELLNFMGKRRIKLTGDVKLTTDDWPYLYIEKPSIPKMYLLIVGALLILILSAKGLLSKLSKDKINWHFFFLGAAFLLLEFQNVSKAALLFGSTWIVNAYIISAILFLILLANLLVYKFKIRNMGLMYGFLLGFIVLNYLVPLNVFNNLGPMAKLIASAVFLNIPIFFAGIIFINSFKQTSSKDTALGSNLMGAAVGGILEVFSFIFGIKALLILVFLLYSVSFAFLEKHE